MTLLSICAATLAANRPAILIAPGHPAAPLLAEAGLALLERQGSALRPPGVEAGALQPLAEAGPLIAVLAESPAAAAALAEGLPAALPRIAEQAAVLPVLVARLAQEMAARRMAEVTGRIAQRALGDQPATLPEMVLDHPPAPGANPMPARLRQPLGRSLDGLCGVEIHLAEAAAGPQSLLRARLTVAGRVFGAWTVPGSALAPGWLPLDLPEPLPPGWPPAALEVIIDAAPGDRLALSASGPQEGAALALRLLAAPQGRRVLPRYCDWAALGHAMTPGVLMALPEGALAAARVQGAALRMVAAGAEPARLLLEIPAGGRVEVVLPALPAGAADLALAEWTCRSGGAGLEAVLLAGPTEPGLVRRSAPQGPDAEGRLRFLLPLPPLPGGSVRLGLQLRLAGEAPATLELSRIGLMAGAAGEPRLAPALPAPAPESAVSPAPRPRPSRPAPPIPLPPEPELEPVGGATAVALPEPAAPPPEPAFAAPVISVALPSPAAEPPSFRSAPPQPPLPIAAPPEPAPAPVRFADPGRRAFQDLKLHQHLANPEGTYRHLDVTLTGLVADAGLWRQVRVKLFDRRGTLGLEFREMKGWPQMFDVWPAGRTDNFGPFWRLETEAPAAALAQLTTPHDRALIAALLELLPSVARRAALAANLGPAEQEAWVERAHRLATAVLPEALGKPGSPGA